MNVAAGPLGLACLLMTAGALAPVAAGAQEPAAGEPPPSSAPVGAWIDGDIYKFRLEEVRRCGIEKAQRHAPFEGDMNRVGVAVRVTAKVGEVPVTPRDLTLEIGGVLYRGELPGKPIPGCGPPLPQRQLRANESVQGVAVFLLPGDVDPAKASAAVSVTFKPTRWGGARQVRVPIPPCFDACPEAKGNRAKGDGAKGASRSRPRPPASEAPPRSPRETK